MALNSRYYLQYPSKKKTIIMLSVSWDGNRVQLSTGQSIDPKIWSKKKQQVKSSASDAFRINQFLNGLKEKLNNYYYAGKAENKIITKIDMKDTIYNYLDPEPPKEKSNEKKDNKTLLQHFEQFIKEREKSRKYVHGTIKRYRNVYNHVRNYQKSKRVTLTFDLMDYKFADDFLSYLIDKKNHTSHTAGKVLKIFKVFLNDAMENELTLNARFVKDFSKAMKEYNTNIEPVLIALTEDELKLIEDYHPETPKLKKVKDMFLIEVYTGTRISDLMGLVKENIDYNERVIRLYSHKTADPLTIPMHRKLYDVLIKYQATELPKMSDQKYNDYIKELGEKAGIDTTVQIPKYYGKKRVDLIKQKFEVMSSHTSRRTFITLSLKKGVLPELVMKIVGIKSRTVFQRYVRLTQNEAVEAINRVWG